MARPVGISMETRGQQAKSATSCWHRDLELIQLKEMQMYSPTRACPLRVVLHQGKRGKSRVPALGSSSSGQAGLVSALLPAAPTITNTLVRLASQPVLNRPRNASRLLPEQLGQHRGWGSQSWPTAGLSWMHAFPSPHPASLTDNCCRTSMLTTHTITPSCCCGIRS